MNRIPLLSKIALSCLFVIFSSAVYSQELDTLKKNTARWIEVKERISKETSAWEVEKEVLKNGIATLSSSKSALEQNVIFHQQESEEIAAKTKEAEERLKAFEKTDTLLLSHIIEYEKRIRVLSKRLPTPLLDEINSLLAKIPTPDATTESPLPNRLQNVVAIMTIVDEFNNNLQLTHTIKELDNGEVIEVRILYWGLATGYATNNAGTRSWMLKPGENGWDWISADSDNLVIKQLFDVYDKTIEPTLVGVPFSFSKTEAAQ